MLQITNSRNRVTTLSTADTDISQASFPVVFAVGADGESVVAWPQASTMEAPNDNVVVSDSPSPGKPPAPAEIRILDAGLNVRRAGTKYDCKVLVVHAPHPREFGYFGG